MEGGTEPSFNWMERTNPHGRRADATGPPAEWTDLSPDFDFARWDAGELPRASEKKKEAAVYRGGTNKAVLGWMCSGEAAG